LVLLLDCMLNPGCHNNTMKVTTQQVSKHPAIEKETWQKENKVSNSRSPNPLTPRQ